MELDGANFNIRTEKTFSEASRENKPKSYLGNLKYENDSVSFSTKTENKKTLSFAGKFFNLFKKEKKQNEPVINQDPPSEPSKSKEEEFIEKTTKGIATVYGRQDPYSDKQKEVISSHIRASISDFEYDYKKAFMDTMGLVDRYELKEFTEEQCEVAISLLGKGENLYNVLTFIKEKSPECQEKVLQHISEGETLSSAIYTVENELRANKKSSAPRRVPPKKSQIENAPKIYKPNNSAEVTTEKVAAPKISSNEEYKAEKVAQKLYDSAYKKCMNFYFPKSLSKLEFLEKFVNLLPDNTVDFDKNYFEKIKENFKELDNKEFGNTIISHISYVQQYENLLDNITEIGMATPIEDGETPKNFMQRIIDIYKKELETEESLKQQKISSVKYDPCDFSTPKDEDVVLKEQEKKILIDKLNENRPSAKLSYEDSMKTIANEWRYSYMGAGIPLYRKSAQDAKFANACLQELPRYEHKEGQPVVRWMNIYEPDKLCGYINSIPNEGETYTFERLQSFSKNTYKAETEFSDYNPDKNIKIVVYPKRKISQARDMGAGQKYGANEIVYPTGSKFKVIYKGYEEGSCKEGAFPRYCVYLQEE